MVCHVNQTASNEDNDLESSASEENDSKPVSSEMSSVNVKWMMIEVMILKMMNPHPWYHMPRPVTA